MAPGLIIAAPASACGKTTVTLGLLRHFRDTGRAVSSFKVGPDYIDPAFHRAAAGGSCHNLDPWAMRPATLARLVETVAGEGDLVIGEGVMGLFDGAPDGTGSTADVAALASWPVVLVVDVSAQADSAAALVRGFAGHRSDVDVAAVVFNRVGGPGHERTLRRACEGLGVPVIGCLPFLGGLVLAERHLGLVQAAEHADLEAYLKAAAQAMGRHLDCEALVRLARPPAVRGAAAGPDGGPPLPPLGRRIAVARDEAFAFAYEDVLQGWRRAGAELVPFSPLADQGPDREADAVYLPGGYPELHAGRLAANGGFLDGLRAADARGAWLFGECGGYMVLGTALTDADGVRHAMAGLLPVETSFAERRLHLGYRQAQLLGDGALGAAGGAFKGHEFHYASVVEESAETPLFACRDALGAEIGAVGAVRGRVMGSFLHLIDRVA